MQRPSHLSASYGTCAGPSDRCRGTCLSGNILIYADTPEKLIDIFVAVLKLLANTGLKYNATKYSLFTECVHYLGRVVSNDGIFPDPAKLEKIRQWPKPDKGKGLASFLDPCNYYSDIIRSFAHLSDAFFKASRLKFIEWTPSHDKQFKDLKHQLLQPRIVPLSDPQRDFILESEGSRTAHGGVVKQIFEDTGLEQPVGFFSRALTGSERNYAAYELELNAVVRAIENFCMFLLDREFLLRTDHAALRKLLLRNLPPTSRVKRWILRFSKYTL